MLELRKGGKLFKLPDHRRKRVKNVTDQAIRLTYEPCVLAKDVTLRDVFKLLNTELDIFDAMFGNWCKEIVEDGFSRKGKPDKDIHYLELYWSLHTGKKWINNGSKETDDWEIYGNGFPQFHGYGDWNDPNVPKGTTGGISVCFSAAADLLDIPLRLSDKLWITNEEDWKAPAKDYDNPAFTLGQILYGIIWELSFHGSPSDTKRTGEKLREIINEAISKDKKTRTRKRKNASKRKRRRAAKTS